MSVFIPLAEEPPPVTNSAKQWKSVVLLGQLSLEVRAIESTYTDVFVPTDSSFLDTEFTLCDDTDNTKQAQFELSEISTSTTTIVTIQDTNGTMALLSDIESLQNQIDELNLQVSILDTLVNYIDSFLDLIITEYNPP